MKPFHFKTVPRSAYHMTEASLYIFLHLLDTEFKKII